MIFNNISEHISYAEATKTFCKIINIPSAEAIENMKLLANAVFEPLRKHFDVPIRINSFYRSHAVNAAIGGSNSSQHMCGFISGQKESAIDISAMNSNLTNADLFQWLQKNVKFDQLIWEFGSNKDPDWVHVSYRDKSNRNRCLKSYKAGGKTLYKVIQ